MKSNPDEFTLRDGNVFGAAIWAAWADCFITTDEAIAAIRKFNAEQDAKV